MESSIRSIDTAIKRCFSIAVEIGRARWGSQKTSQIAGPVGTIPMSVVIDPKKVPSMDEVAIVTGLDTPLDRPALLQYITSLASSQGGNQPLLSPQEFKRGLQAIGVNLPGIDLVDPDEEQAWLENFQIYGDGVEPGNVEPPNPTLENSAVHLASHKRFAASPEAHHAEEAVRMALAYHIQLTAQAVGGGPIPAEFDTSLNNADERYIGEEVIANRSSPVSELLSMGA